MFIISHAFIKECFFILCSVHSIDYRKRREKKKKKFPKKKKTLLVNILSVLSPPPFFCLFFILFLTITMESVDVSCQTESLWTAEKQDKYRQMKKRIIELLAVRWDWINKKKKTKREIETKRSRRCFGNQLSQDWTTVKTIRASTKRKRERDKKRKGIIMC